MRRRLLTVSPDNEPLWVRLYVEPYADRWAAMLVGERGAHPDPGTRTGLTRCGATPDEVDGGAQATVERDTREGGIS